jgi:hypothetical protein
VNGPAPLLEFFKRGEVARDVRLLAAQGALAPRAHEQIAILVLLLDDADEEIRRTANDTLNRIPEDSLRAHLGRSDVPNGVREFFAARGVVPAEASAGLADDPLIDADPSGEDFDVAAEGDTEEQRRESITQRLAKMGFSERLKAAVKGSREMRAILVRDPNKMIASSVLSSPKLTQNEVEAISRMTNVSEDVLRIIGNNRAWTKNYSVIVGLTKNPKTPLGMSLNFLGRLNTKDLQGLSIDRNVPESLRVAARKKLVAGTSGKG